MPNAFFWIWARGTMLGRWGTSIFWAFLHMKQCLHRIFKNRPSSNLSNGHTVAVAGIYFISCDYHVASHQAIFVLLIMNLTIMALWLAQSVIYKLILIWPIFILYAISILMMIYIIYMYNMNFYRYLHVQVNIYI